MTWAEVNRLTVCEATCRHAAYAHNSVTRQRCPTPLGDSLRPTPTLKSYTIFTVIPLEAESNITIVLPD